MAETRSCVLRHINPCRILHNIDSITYKYLSVIWLSVHCIYSVIDSLSFIVIVLVAILDTLDKMVMDYPSVHEDKPCTVYHV